MYERVDRFIYEFIECLFYSKHCSRYWGCNSKQSRQKSHSCPHEAYLLEIGWVNKWVKMLNKFMLWGDCITIVNIDWSGLYSHNLEGNMVNWLRAPLQNQIHTQLCLLLMMNLGQVTYLPSALASSPRNGYGIVVVWNKRCNSCRDHLDSFLLHAKHPWLDITSHWTLTSALRYRYHWYLGNV